MSKQAELSIGEVLTNRKTGETFTVKELTDTVAVLNNNKGYKLTSIMKTFKKATEVITDVNIDTDKMDKAAEPVKVITISRNAIIKAFESKYCRWTVDMPKEENVEREPAVAQDEPEEATATAHKQEAEKKATAPTTDIAELRQAIIELALAVNPAVRAEEKTSYTSIKYGNKCVAEIYKGKKKFNVAVGDSYIEEELVNMAKITKQPFPNNCYFNSATHDAEILKEAVYQAVLTAVTQLSVVKAK